MCQVLMVSLFEYFSLSIVDIHHHQWGNVGIFPGQGKVIWRDWYTHDVVNASVGTNTTLDAPLGHINIHVRDGSILLLHSEPAYTVEETRQGPFELLVSLSSDGAAFGTAYLDDGLSSPPGPSSNLIFHAADGHLTIKPSGKFRITQKLDRITILGVKKLSSVMLGGKKISQWQFSRDQAKLVIENIDGDLNTPLSLKLA